MDVEREKESSHSVVGVEGVDASLAGNTSNIQSRLQYHSLLTLCTVVDYKRYASIHTVTVNLFDVETYFVSPARSRTTSNLRLSTSLYLSLPGAVIY